MLSSFHSNVISQFTCHFSSCLTKLSTLRLTRKMAPAAQKAGVVNRAPHFAARQDCRQENGSKQQQYFSQSPLLNYNDQVAPQIKRAPQLTPQAPLTER